MAKMYFSALEQHNDGSWWYHGDTFGSRMEAEQFLKEWIWWDKDRKKEIVQHQLPFPGSGRRSYWTRDFRQFYNVGGREVCRI